MPDNPAPDVLTRIAIGAMRARGLLPLVFASGAGAASRFSIGLVISTGLAIGTLFTLFVVPGVYMLIGADHSRNTAALPLGLPEPHT